MSGPRINFKAREEPILEAIIDKNFHFVSAISRETKIPYEWVRQYLKLNELDIKTYRYREKLKQIIDSLSSKQFSMDGIGKKLNLKRRGSVLFRLKEYDLHNYYNENKKKIKELKKQFNQYLYNKLYDPLFQTYNILLVAGLSNKKPAEKDALIVYFTGYRKRQPLEFYIDVFQRYYDDLSIRQTAKSLGKPSGYIKYLWDKRGLKSHYKRGGKPLPLETIDKIVEAHNLKMSKREAAEYSGASQISIRNVWDILELKPHYGPIPPLPQSKINKIYQAHKLKMTIPNAATYASVSYDSVSKYWRKKKLEPHFKKN